jgi:ABC-type multidrug transport system fused ATPase/permease subunit
LLLIGADCLALPLLTSLTKPSTHFVISSGGSSQLLCFARALLERRPILVLDEATSNLDADSDARIQRLLRRSLTNTTLLTVAHRLATVIDFDTILVLGRGELLEQVR